MTITLPEFLLLEGIKKGIQRMKKNNFDHTKVSLSGFSDKVLLTTQDLSGCKSSLGFKIEKVTQNIFAVLPKEISLIRN